jgi:hypothetical protein
MARDAREARDNIVPIIIVFIKVESTAEVRLRKAAPTEIVRPCARVHSIRRRTAAAFVFLTR